MEHGLTRFSISSRAVPTVVTLWMASFGMEQEMSTAQPSRVALPAVERCSGFRTFRVALGPRMWCTHSVRFPIVLMVGVRLAISCSTRQGTFLARLRPLYSKSLPRRDILDYRFPMAP